MSLPSRRGRWDAGAEQCGMDWVGMDKYGFMTIDVLFEATSTFGLDVKMTVFSRTDLSPANVNMPKSSLNGQEISAAVDLEIDSARKMGLRSAHFFHHWAWDVFPMQPKTSQRSLDLIRLSFDPDSMKRSHPFCCWAPLTWTFTCSCALAQGYTDEVQRRRNELEFCRRGLEHQPVWTNLVWWDWMVFKTISASTRFLQQVHISRHEHQNSLPDLWQQLFFVFCPVLHRLDNIAKPSHWKTAEETNFSNFSPKSWRYERIWRIWMSTAVSAVWYESKRCPCFPEAIWSLSDIPPGKRWPKTSPGSRPGVLSLAQKADVGMVALQKIVVEVCRINFVTLQAIKLCIILPEF